MVREATTAREAWETLRTFFVQKNLHNRVQLRKQLYDFEMAPGENLMDHLMQFEDLCLRLTGVGETVTDDEKLVILLGSLPAEYDGMIKLIEAHGSVTLLDAK
ncbi:Retrovirus-related Pol polyprotein from transposon TNT 1-94 [Phytophthora citrophthora]|uniref:Retrovirus-related Pol polyprotein from transposon TNT 1-94 n=1 Tax=Phytophthora citrophthora TaxID=4793 RepID=A0AAD9GNI4_9STRA|nr:Retrovirus-related Pol polyprotein from transposon TNT 1-94 [Phytophthora citrophthora]